MLKRHHEEADKHNGLLQELALFASVLNAATGGQLAFLLLFLRVYQAWDVPYGRGYYSRVPVLYTGVQYGTDKKKSRKEAISSNPSDAVACLEPAFVGGFACGSRYRTSKVNP